MEKIKKNRNQKSIRTTIFGSFFCVGVVPLLVFAVIAAIIVKKSMYKSEVSSLRQIASLISENMDQWGEENILFVEDIATSQIITSSDIDSKK